MSGTETAGGVKAGGATAAGTAAGGDALPVSAAAGWRGGFGRLWAAAVVSRVGDSLRTAALPLLAVTLTDDPLLVAAVTACGFLPWLLFGLLGGAVADRVDQRRAMWAVDLARGALVAGFALAVALGHASIVLLLVLAFALTSLGTLFDNAASALLPAVVPAEALASANARLLTGQQMAGGILAAPLVPVLLLWGPALPYAVDAATYLLAALLIASLRPAAVDRPPRPAGSTLRAETAEGLRTLWRDGVLRRVCAATTLTNVAVGALIATLVLHVTDWLGAGSGGYAAALTAYAAGAVAGGLVARKPAERLGRIRAVLLAGAVQTAALLALGAVRELWALLPALAVFGLMGMVWNVQQTTLLQERTPAATLGRTSAAFRTLAIAGAPLGALLGGAAATWAPNAPALLAAGLFGLATVSLAGQIN